MVSPPRPLLACLVLAALCSGVVGTWLLRSLGAPPQASGTPGLVDLLGPQGSPAPRPGVTPGQPPRPPAQAPWQSPLADECRRPPLAEQRRLLAAWQQRDQITSHVAIDPSNYGPRYQHDAYGRPIPHRPSLIVLHETVYSLDSALGTFRTPHPRDEDQVSYHALIGLDGRIVKVLDPEKRAFGAGNSAFQGLWLITNPRVGGSINNVALHVSLETPADGEHNGPEHSGYSSAQYDALALLLGEWMLRYRIPAKRITTHSYVDLGGERSDPRSLSWQTLGQRLAALGFSC